MFIKGLEKKVREHARSELVDRLARNGSASVEGIGTFEWREGQIVFVSDASLIKSVNCKRFAFGKKN